MKRNFLKGFISFVVLTLSPFVILAIAGLIYISFKTLSGIPISNSFQSFVSLIFRLAPYVSYLTVIPIIIVVIILILRNRHKVLK